MRPQDLVGAITGESQLTGREIGAIEIQDRFSLVEVPLEAADGVIAALRASTVKGKRATVRRERFERGGAPQQSAGLSTSDGASARRPDECSE